MVIFTPATAPPCESMTVPAIRPKMLWAAAVLTIQVVNKTANRNAAVFNENPGKSTPLTTWFDLDSFVVTRTPPSKKIEITSPAYSFWPTSFFFHPVPGRPPEENLGKSPTQRLAYCIVRRHLTNSLPLKKGPPFASRRWCTSL